MANANSTPVSNNPLKARELLDEAAMVATFIQEITLSHNINIGGGVVTGFYLVMQDLIDRINKAEALIAEEVTQ